MVDTGLPFSLAYGWSLSAQLLRTDLLRPLILFLVRGGCELIIIDRCGGVLERLMLSKVLRILSINYELYVWLPLARTN